MSTTLNTKNTTKTSHADSRLRLFVPLIGAICAAIVVMLVVPISAAIPIATVAIIAGLLVAFLIGRKKG